MKKISFMFFILFILISTTVCANWSMWSPYWRIQNVPAEEDCISIEQGWNLIGWYQPYNTTAKSLLENISGTLSVSKWDPVAQSYWAYFDGGPSSFDFAITRGMGLFVETTEQSTWCGEG